MTRARVQRLLRLAELRRDLLAIATLGARLTAMGNGAHV